MSAPPDPLPELLSFLDAQPEPRIVMATDYRIVAANRAYQREFGQGQPVQGRYCYEVSHRFSVPCDQAGETCPLRLSLEDGEARRVLHLHHTPRGEEHVAVETTPIRDPQGEVLYFVESMQVVRQASTQPAAEGLVGRSPAFNAMLAQIMRVAPTAAAVLLLGETGTGKELVARLVHETSKRAAGPFVAVDCSGLTETLFESELFGYEKGAFTGANHRKTGLVEAASGGTLFLDEIGDVPLPMQVKLLRLLESGTYRRVGGIDTLRSDFRLVCATHRDLPALVEQERFRRDLFHRIEVFPVHVPSLAERAEDIPLLAESFLKRVAPERSLNLSPAAVAALRQGRYPGNIRQLRNLIERASILADNGEIGPEHLGGYSYANVAAAPEAAGDAPFVVDEVLPLASLESRYLAWLKARYPGQRKALAAALGLSPRTLFRKLAGERGDAGPAESC
jgi:DNA-binding NtrC family response regulator